MSDWSDYFEHFPQKNPANWVDGKFNPEFSAKLLEDKHHDEIIEQVKQEAKVQAQDYPKRSLTKLYTSKLMKHFTHMNAKIMEYMEMTLHMKKH